MSENNFYPFVNLPLPYDYDALEPYIDEKTMRLHHDKHLQTYIDNLNSAIEKAPGLKTLRLDRLIACADKLPRPLQNTIRNNAGGVFNHRFYFDGLSPAGGKPSAMLINGIKQAFGSFDVFKRELKDAALSVFGSGYAWLVADGNKLKIVTSANQNVPPCRCLLLNIDVWEHAYYLKHYNVRADYIDDLFEVIDFDKIDRRYRNCILRS